jgi:N-acetylglucosamine kinase-like BadF-type ATPase
MDNGLPECALTQGLLEHIGSQRLRSLVELAYSRPKGETAALSRVVASLCRKGDSRACALLRQAGEELAGMALALAGRLALADPAVALMGGILENIEPVRQAFSARLLGNIPGAVLQTEPVEPQRGALYLLGKERK